MSSYKFKRASLLAVGAVVCAVFAGQGCSSDSSPQVTPPPSAGGSAGSAGSGTSGSAGSGTSGSAGSGTSGSAGSGTSGSAGSGTAGSAGSGTAGSAGDSGSAGTGTAGSAGSGGSAGGTAGSSGSGGTAGGANCSGPKGCYTCAPTDNNNDEFHNHCITGGCDCTSGECTQGFDNTTLTLPAGGGLPPLVPPTTPT